jgi:prophage regulatory protein
VKRRSPKPRAQRTPSAPRTRPARRTSYELLMEELPKSQPASPLPITTLPPQAPVRLLRLPEVMQRVGLRRAAIYTLLREGKFPQQVRLGARAVAWVESEVEEWIARRIHARQSAAMAPPRA